jgi:hypothetical protein
MAVVGGGGLLLVGGLIVWMELDQYLMDQERVTYKLTFPIDVSLETAALLFDNLSGMLKQPIKVLGVKVPSVTAYPTIVVEILSTPEWIGHLITFPRHYERSVRGSLMGTIPNLGFEQVSPVYGEWTVAVELDTARLNHDPNHKKIAALLSSFRELAQGQAVLAQFVLRPAHYSTADSDTPSFYVAGRLAARGHEMDARALISDVNFQYGGLQVFTFRLLPETELHLINDRATPQRWPAMLSTKALAVVCGLPIDGPQVLGLDMNKGRHLPPASSIPSDGPIILGTSTYSGAQRPITTTTDNLMRHQWTLGRTNSGKSTLMHNEAAQIMADGKGLILIEPDGRLAASVLASVPKDRVDDVIWFDPNDKDRSIGFNILYGPDPERTAGYIVGLFKGMYADSWGPRLEQILNYAVLTAAYNRLTIYDVKQLLINPDFRGRVLKQTDHTEVKSFWRRLDDGPDNAMDSVSNKLDAFLRSRQLRNIVGQADGLDIAEIVRQGKILLVPLAGEEIGAPNASILGSVLVSRIWSEIRLRKDGIPIVLMLDEFQNYMEHSASILSIFDEARKYKLGLIVANQRIDQLGTSMLSAVQANALTKVAFNVSPEDAKRIQGHFPPLSWENLAGQEQFHAAMAIDTGQGIAPTVTVQTNPSPAPTGYGWLARETSRASYGASVSKVEAQMREQHKVAETPDRPKFGRRSE